MKVINKKNDFMSVFDSVTVNKNKTRWQIKNTILYCITILFTFLPVFQLSSCRDDKKNSPSGDEKAVVDNDVPNNDTDGASDNTGRDDSLLNIRGELDGDFGIGGIATYSLSDSDDATDLALIPSGGMVAIGNTYKVLDTAAPYRPGMLYIKSNGSVDSSASRDGRFRLSLGQGGYGVSILAQNDNRVVIAFNDGDLSLARFNIDRTLDASFGVNGVVHTDFGTIGDEPKKIIQDSDGRLIAVGKTIDNAIIARYTSNGSLDTEFNSTGKYIYSTLSTGFNSVAVQSDGKIVAVGHRLIDQASDILVLRLNENGTPDTGFNGTGDLNIDISGNNSSSNFVDYATAVQITSSGKILIAGQGYDGNNDSISLVRLNSDGTLDTTFGSGGKLIVNLTGTKIVVHTMVLDKEGRIVVGGNVENIDNSNSDFFIARFLDNGQIDASFGRQGYITTDIYGDWDELKSLQILNNGRILATGYAYDGSVSAVGEFCVVRYK